MYAEADKMPSRKGGHVYTRAELEKSLTALVRTGPGRNCVRGSGQNAFQERGPCLHKGGTGMEEMEMRRRRRDGARKEKMIMALSSVFVLAALTATGLFIRERNEDKSDGYVVDFSSLENNGDGTAQNEARSLEEMAEAKLDGNQQGIEDNAVTSDDLDYDPYFQETDSLSVENTDGEGNGTNPDAAKPDSETDGDKKAQAGKDKGKESDKDKEKNETGSEGMIDGAKDTADSGEEESVLEEVAAMEEMEDTMAIATSTSIQPALTFSDGDTLAWPIVGNVLINYSMDKTVYFPTLEQYKYNPAIIIAAVEGETVTAAANGKVRSIRKDPELGNVIVMELGNGYELTYGQIKDITVSEGGFVNRGEIIGNVAAPTKYYTVEGCNVYFKLTKDGAPINPMSKLN